MDKIVAQGNVRERARKVALDVFGMPGLSDDTSLHGLTFGAVVNVAAKAAREESADLLAALRDCMPRMENYEDSGPLDEGWQSEELIALIEQARAAIAKAEGGAA